MVQGNALTDFLVLAGGAAFLAVAFVVFLGDAMGVVAGRRALVDPQSGHAYRSRGAIAATTLFTVVMTAAAMYVTFRFATDPHDMPDINRALFWLSWPSKSRGSSVRCIAGSIALISA